jgi:hypothetical protein
MSLKKAVVPAALALIAVAALVGGIPFAAAEEGSPEFKAGESPATLSVFSASGLHEQYIRVTNEKGENLDVKCNVRTAHVESLTTFPTTSIQARAGFGECEVDGEAKSAAAGNGCEYKFNLVAASSPPTATMDIICPAGKEIEFEGSKCKVTIPAQTGLKHVIYSNNSKAVPPDAVETFSITSLEYKIKAGCRGQAKNQTKTNGIYTDGLTMQARNKFGFSTSFAVE